MNRISHVISNPDIEPMPQEIFEIVIEKVRDPIFFISDLRSEIYRQIEENINTLKLANLSPMQIEKIQPVSNEVFFFVHEATYPSSFNRNHVLEESYRQIQKMLDKI